MAVPALVVAAGCGSGDGDGSNDAEPATQQEVTAEETGEAAPERAESADEPAGDDEQPAGDSSGDSSDDPSDDQGGDTSEATMADVDDTGSVFAGDPGSDWCVAARDIEVLSNALDTENLNFADPAAVESAYTALLDAVDDARGLAPSEIAADVETTYNGFSQLADALAAVDWNFLDADLSIIDELDAEMTAAGDRVGDYNEQVCGIAQDDDDDIEAADGGDDFDPSAGTPREQMAAGLVALGFTVEEADCIVRNVDIAMYLETEDDNLIVEAFDACEIPASRLVEVGGG